MFLGENSEFRKLNCGKCLKIKGIYVRLSKNIYGIDIPTRFRISYLWAEQKAFIDC